MKYLLETQQRLLVLYGQKTFSPSDSIPYPILQMRKRLVIEETHELLYAINDFSVDMPSDQRRAHFLKEFCDTLVVLFGTAAQLGFTDEELEEAYDIVHLDNMSKAYAHEADALIARDYYRNNKHGDYHVKEVQLHSVERNVDDPTFTVYVVANEEGKTMKRYPAPATTAEERILQYIVAEQQ